MAHFAQLKNSSDNTVVKVVVVHDNEAPTEEAGITFLKSLYGSETIWKQTSYNTYAGEHRLDGVPFRKNFAGNGMVYDEARDAFISPQPYPSWILNETTCCWDAPVPMPEEDPEPAGRGIWDEEDQQWVVE